MTIDKIFYGYMTLVGIAVGAILVAAPQDYDFLIKPYFWVLIAVLLFDCGAYLLSRQSPWTVLSMNARMIGFVIGLLLMAAIPTLTGSSVRFF
jgi:hypothetical protein